MIELIGPSVADRPERGIYRIAGRTVAVSPPLDEIEAFRRPGGAGEESGAAGSIHPPDRIDRIDLVDRPERAGGGTLLYRGPAWIGNAERTVQCLRLPEGFRIAIEGIGRLAVTADGRYAALTAPVAAAGPSLCTEALLGPALILALALGGTFSVHASAVMAGPAGPLVAFVGPSGAGKSTLARLLDGARPGWRRVADDILPLAHRDAAGGGPTAFPHFPQLKLAADAQPGAGAPEALPVAALFVLGRRGTDGSPGPVSRPLPKAAAALALVRHTASARLFDGPLLDRHLDLCTAVAERLPVAELDYPWRGEVVPGLAETVAAGLEAA